MSSVFYELYEAWRQVEHVAEWSGLSVGMLAVLAVLIYLDPTLRGFAIRCAVVIFVAYIGTVYGDYVGARDKQEQWDAASVQVAAEEKERDTNAAKSASVDEQERLSQLASGEAIDQGIIDALSKLDKTCHPITGNQLR